MDFTDKEYRALVKLSFLGSMVMNAVLEEEDYIENYGGLEEKIWANSKLHDCPDLIRENEENRFEPTEEMVSELFDALDEYNDIEFWERLTVWMADKELKETLGKEIEKMKPEAYLKAREPVYKKYDEEFTVNGLVNLVIKPQE